MARSLTTRLAVWISAIFIFTMAIFAAVAYVVVYVEERDEIGRETAESPAEVADDVEVEVLEALAVAAPIGLALSVGGAIWLARRTLAPMRDVIRVATEISAERLDRRLPVPATADEVSALVVALNALLARLEAGFAAQARFAADASHELRTPLAVIASQLEVALRRPRSEAEWVGTATTVLEEVRRITRLSEALLRLRRAEVTVEGRETDRETDLATLVDTVASRHTERVVVVGDIPSARIRGDSDELAAALENLVANAVRTGAAVRIRAEAPAGGEQLHVHIHVEDDGPGIAPGDEERIFTPFYRGESSDGFGLGLPIARAVATSVGGRLDLAPSSRGAHFVLTLPLAS